MEQYKVKWLEQTCDCCPSQWEGKLEDGRMFYVRYRFGVFKVLLSNNPTDNLDDCWDNGKEIVYECDSDSFNGFMTEDEMIELLEQYNFNFENYETR